MIQLSPTKRMPEPAPSSRWRWSTPRAAAVCGGAVVAALSFGSLAGASTAHHGASPTSAPHLRGPMTRGAQPTAGGKITTLSGDDVTLAGRNSASQTVVYSASTTFATMSGSTTSSALKVGEFITVHGTKKPDGDVDATSIMISTGPPGGPKGNPARGQRPTGVPPGERS